MRFHFAKENDASLQDMEVFSKAPSQERLVPNENDPLLEEAGRFFFGLLMIICSRSFHSIFIGYCISIGPFEATVQARALHDGISVNNSEDDKNVQHRLELA